MFTLLRLLVWSRVLAGLVDGFRIKQKASNLKMETLSAKMASATTVARKAPDVKQCKCNSEGTQGSGVNKWCWLDEDHRPSQCLLLNKDTPSSFAWVICEHGGRKQVECPQICPTVTKPNFGRAAHVGIEVEFADQKIARKLQKKGQLVNQTESHECSEYLKYGVGWFSSVAQTEDLVRTWGVNLPVFEVESEKYDRNTIEVVSGPLKGDGVVKMASAILKFSKALRGQGSPFPLDSADSQKVTFKSIAEDTFGEMNSQILNNDCEKKIFVKTENSGLLAGVQVNFEMKLSQVPKLVSDSTAASYFNFGGDTEYWQKAVQCVAAVKDVTGKNYGNVQIGAMLLTFHQSAVVEACEARGRDSTCKLTMHVSLLPKVALDGYSEAAGGRVTLHAITGLTWDEWKEFLSQQNQTKKQCFIPASWRPDDKMFSRGKILPGLGGIRKDGTFPNVITDEPFAAEILDPIVVMESRSGTSDLVHAVKNKFLNYFESGPGAKKDPATDPGPAGELNAVIGKLQSWAFKEACPLT